MNRSAFLSNSSRLPVEGGHALLTVTVLLAVTAIVTTASLRHSSQSARIHSATAVRGERYIEGEESLGRAVSWLRANSTGLALPFSRSVFYRVFDRTTPTFGINEGGADGVRTKIKLQGTTNSVVLTTDQTLVTSAHPASTDAISGVPFDAQAGFASSGIGPHGVRVTLIDGVPANPAGDFGDPDQGNPDPTTDFNPVYRIDTIESIGAGTHLVGYVVGSLTYDFGIGFFGRDFVDLRQSCDSYLSNSGNYSSSSKRANCAVASQNLISIHSTETVYGSGRTNGQINSAPPYNGQVCADFSPGCPTPGQRCVGASCNVPALPQYSAWQTYCPTNQGTLQVTANSTLLVPGNSAQQKCWNQITVNNNRVLTLRTTSYAYFIDTLSLANNAQVNFAPTPSTGTINLYVRKFVGDSFNGNQIYNINNKPYQLRIHYLGTANLTLNGSAAMNAFIIAPYAQVTIQGSFDYKGGIKATGLTLTGSGDLHYDESGDITTISDVSYKLRSLSQVYPYD